jgi:uncharacterized membrane protein
MATGTAEPSAATPTAPSRGLASIRGGGPLTIAILVVCLLGLLDASYLTYEHYNGLKGLLCVGGHGGHSSCQTVQSSAYSKVVGIPVALLGLIGYVALFGTFLLRGELARVSAFGISLMGFAFSMYLTYREIFTIKAICEWCVGSAVFMTVLVVLTGIRFLRADPTAGP